MENNTIQQENNQPTNAHPAAAPQIKVPAPVTKKDESKEPVGYFTYLGLFILFAIPVIGWIACAILMFVPKKKSLNNYARAIMTKLLIKLLIVFLIASILGAIFLPVINSALGTNFNNIGEIVSMAGGVVTGNYTGVIRAMRSQIIGALGQEYAPIIDEISKDEYNVLIKQIIDAEYEQALYDLKADKYPALPGVVGKDLYNEFIDELEAEVNGEDTMFDEFREVLPSLIEEFTGGTMDFGSLGGISSTENKLHQSAEVAVAVQ